MIKVSAEVKKARRTMRNIERRDLPGAKAAAYKWAGKRAVTRASKRLAASLNVPTWMVRGFKGKGSRFGITRYSKRADGISVYFRFRHINPTGTKYKPAKVRTTKAGVRASKHIYRDAYHKPGRWGNGVIYKRQPSGGVEIARIDIPDGQVAVTKAMIKRIVPAAFKRRFAHEFGRRVARRGAR